VADLEKHVTTRDGASATARGKLLYLLRREYGKGAFVTPGVERTRRSRFFWSRHRSRGPLPPSVHEQLGPGDSTAAVGREKDNGFRVLIGCFAFRGHPSRPGDAPAPRRPSRARRSVMLVLYAPCVRVAFSTISGIPDKARATGQVAFASSAYCENCCSSMPFTRPSVSISKRARVIDPS